MNNEKWVLYSTCDEDALSELKALEINDKDDVLCVTGSACRTLSLMTKNPSSITSVDYSAGQNYLLELKLAAMKNLDYDTLLYFMGVENVKVENKSRLDIFMSLCPYLSSKAIDYFYYYMSAIKKGVLYQGRHEKFYRNFLSPFLHLIYGRALKELFEANDLNEQKNIYYKRIRGPFWKLMITKGFNKMLLKAILNNPDYETEFEIGDLGDYMLKTIDHTFLTHLAKDNDWLSLMLNGKYLNRNALPHFLLHDSYLAIRESNTSINIVTTDLVEFSKGSAANKFSKFSLSDVTSCIAKVRFNTLLGEIPRIGREGGKLCYRNFIARHLIPSELAPLLKRENDLCTNLDVNDRAFSYQFEVASISQV